MPVYNTPAVWLHQAMESILGQEGARYEIVLVDDGSTRPDTLQALTHWARSPVVQFVRSPKNEGIGAACNKGVWAARSDLIARFDSDDVMMPGRLATQLAYLREHPEADLISGQMIVMDETGKDLETTRTVYHAEWPFWEQPNNCCPILHGTATYRRMAAIRAGLYPPDSQCQDFALWCAMQAAGCKMVVTENVWMRYRKYNWTDKTATRIAHHNAVVERFRGRVGSFAKPF
jgi:glycosyltransferase involved in cell wall biosynthesis